MTSSYLTEKQLSELIGVGIKKLQRMRMKGNGIPFIKIGRSIRYDLTKVQEFMEKQTRTSTKEIK